MSDLNKIPVTVVTGFLGAGKTTLIRHLMQNPQGKRLGVVVNEFGTTGVDGDILKSCADENCPENNIVELANGCICCTVADDFIPTIEALMAMPEPPEHILIETSGLALPKPLLKAFDWPAIRSRITVDGLIALSDAEAVAAGRFATDVAAVDAQREADDSIDHETPLSEVFEDQISCADIILLSKADLAGKDGVEKARAVIAEESPRNLPILPIHMKARNSGLFYWFAKWSTELRDMTVFYELLNKKGNRFDVTVGQMIQPDQLEGDLADVTKAIETHTVSRLGADGDAIFGPVTSSGS